MGDVAMATAVMEDLRRAFPDAVIDLNVLPAFAGLFAGGRSFRACPRDRPERQGSWVEGNSKMVAAGQGGWIRLGLRFPEQ